MATGPHRRVRARLWSPAPPGRGTDADRDPVADGHASGFDGQTSGIDERWAVPGAGLLVIFKAMVGGSARRVTVHATLGARDAQGLEARLFAADTEGAAALQGLLTARSPAPGAASPPDLASDCLAVVRQQLPDLITAYLDALAASLTRTAGSDAQRGRNNLLMLEFGRRRRHMAAAITDAAMASVAAYFGDEAAQVGANATTGLSLLESIDLRASLLVTEVVAEVAHRVMPTWTALEARLARVVPANSEGDALAPAVFCHHFRDAIFFDHALGPLRQIDLTAGYDEGFVARLNALYRDLLKLLERHGISASRPARGKPDAISPR